MFASNRFIYKYIYLHTNSLSSDIDCQVIRSCNTGISKICLLLLYYAARYYLMHGRVRKYNSKYGLQRYHAKSSVWYIECSIRTTGHTV